MPGLSPDEFLARDRIGALIGARFVSLRDGVCTYEYEATDAHHNPGGILHGGALYSVMDSSQGMLIFSLVEPAGAAATGTATIKYLAPVRRGRITVTTKLERREGRKLFVRSEAVDDAGTTVATFDAVWITLQPSPPKPFELWSDGSGTQRYLHGTKANLAPGDLIEAGRASNYGDRPNAGFVYLTATLDAATWGAELAIGEGRGRIYIVEPTGPIEDDPNLTDKKFPGNPTRSYRTRAPLRVVGELTAWAGHPADQVQAMKDHIAQLAAQGIKAIE